MRPNRKFLELGLPFLNMLCLDKVHPRKIRRVFELSHEQSDRLIVQPLSLQDDRAPGLAHLGEPQGIWRRGTQILKNIDRTPALAFENINRIPLRRKLP